MILEKFVFTKITSEGNNIDAIKQHPEYDYFVDGTIKFVSRDVTINNCFELGLGYAMLTFLDQETIVINKNSKVMLQKCFDRFAKINFDNESTTECLVSFLELVVTLIIEYFANKVPDTPVEAVIDLNNQNTYIVMQQINMFNNDNSENEEYISESDLQCDLVS